MTIKINGNKSLNVSVRFANTFWQKLKGLMFTQKKDFDYALIFNMNSESRFGNAVHMFFVFYPILAVFVNSKNEVVDKTILPPFIPYYAPKKKCKYIIEMPTKYDSKIVIGQKLIW